MIGLFGLHADAMQRLLGTYPHPRFPVTMNNMRVEH